jgi:hypothetical protein
MEVTGRTTILVVGPAIVHDPEPILAISEPHNLFPQDPALH